MPEVGRQATDFSLPSTTGTVLLFDLLAQGPVVLAFYTEDATPACERELTIFAADYQLLRDLGAQVLAISVDSLTTHAAFAVREGGFPFPLATDEGGAVARLYGVFDDETSRSRRAVFVIGRNGVVLHANPFYNPANLEQFQAVFAALGLV